MKLVLVTSMAALLGLGMGGEARAHDYVTSARGAVGGTVYWADSNLAIGLSYGAPVVRPYYVPPPRYVYQPRVYRGGYRDAYRYGKHRGYRNGYGKGYKKGYGRGYKKGHGHRGHGRGDRHRH